MTEQLKKEIVAAAQNIIFANEGNYGSVNADDNGAVSVGKVQWHGTRALNLLKQYARWRAGQQPFWGLPFIVKSQRWQTGEPGP